MTDPEQRSRDLERAATCLAHDPSCSVSVNIGATVTNIADALAEREREVWQRVLDLAAEQDIDVAAFAAIDADPRDIADPLKAAALAILRAAAEGSKP